MTPTVLKLSVCLFNNVTALDYLGPIEQLGFLSEAAPVTGQYGSSAVLLRISYLAPTLDPVKPSRGPYVLPTATYAQMRDSGEQADILLLPGGRGARPDAVPQELIEYIQTQSTRCKYLLSVCTGSWILAHAGLLEGKEATTNKAAFKECKEQTSETIKWIAKARWVVDENIWTSSGVTAGQDMANAFIEHLVGKEIADEIRGIVELSRKEQEDDEFAAFYGLL